MTQNRAERRVLVVGLDGASLELLAPWLDSGDLPNLSALIREGVSGGLETVPPPLTPPAWTSAVTGVNPGKHGIFNFNRPLSRNPEVALYGSTDRRVPALWEILKEYGRRSIILHLPATHPPRPLDGCLVVGFPVTTLSSTCTYPPTLKDDLIAALPGYRLYPDTFNLTGKGDKDAYFRDAVETLKLHEREALLLMEREAWDLCFTLWHMGDSLMHFFWDDMRGASEHPHRAGYLRDYYMEADRALGRLVDAAGPETTVIVMSDHGHGGVDRAIFVNSWLRQNGFLKIRMPKSFLIEKILKKARKKLGMPLRQSGINDQSAALTTQAIRQFEKSVVWDETFAYAICPGIVWLNVKGREPHGVVEPGEDYDAVLDELREGLAAITDPKTRKPVFDRILTRDEAYHGDAMAEAPDLILLPADGYITEYGPQKPNVVGDIKRFGFNGYHRMSGLFVARGPELRTAATIEGARILDVAPTILRALDLPVPTWMDGAVLEAAFFPEALTSTPVRYEDVDIEAPRPTDGELDREAVERSLRDLGYM